MRRVRGCEAGDPVTGRQLAVSPGRGPAPRPVPPTHQLQAGEVAAGGRQELATLPTGVPAHPAQYGGYWQPESYVRLVLKLLGSVPG